MGLTGLWVAVLADSGATALVTANAVRLLRVMKNNHGLLTEKGCCGIPFYLTTRIVALMCLR